VGAQERHTLPPGPPPGPAQGTASLVGALFVQANMFEGGQVLILGPSADDTSPPGMFVKVDGKAVRAFGTDRKPLDINELNKLLSTGVAAVVVHGQAPDPFFLKALNERSVVFVVPKKLFDRLAKAASPELLAGFWNVMKAGEKTGVTGDHWIIEEKKIALH